MSNLMIFENNEVEVFEFNGEILFNPKHVAACLEIKNVNDAINDFNSRQVIKLKNSDIANTDFRKLNNAGENFLTEKGVYKLIFKSRKPEAERFQDWVTDEVLPAIRRTGGYIPTTPQMSEQEIMAKAVQISMATIAQQKDVILALESRNAMQEQIIHEMQPKADYTDMILQSKSVVNINQIAKDYGMTAQEMNKILHEIGVQYKQGGQWLLYKAYHSYGYTHSETFNITHRDGTPDVVMNTKWTQKGRLFLYEKLKEHGYLPMIERGA